MPQGEGRKFREVPDVCSAGLNQVTDKRKPALAQGQGWKKSWKIFGFCLTGAAWRDGGAWRKGELRSQDQQLEQDSDTSQVAQIQHWGLPRGSQNPVPCSDPITCWVNSVAQLLQYPISFALDESQMPNAPRVGAFGSALATWTFPTSSGDIRGISVLGTIGNHCSCSGWH